MRLPRVVLLTCACVLSAFGSLVSAQSVPCTAPPPPSPGFTPSVVPGASTLTPAMLNLVWAGVPPDGNRGVTSYVIEVGTELGRTDIARIDTGTSGVNYANPAANGTYFIRILAKNACGLSAPTADVSVLVTGSTPSGQPAARAMTSNSIVTRDAFGDIMLIGEVRGALGARPTAFVRVTGTFQDSAGGVVGTDFTYIYGRSRRLSLSRIIDDATLGPGESACFLMYTSIAASRVAQSFVGVSWNTSELEPLRGAVVVDGARREADTFGDLKVQGLLRNVGATTTYFNQIYLEARDAENRVIDCDFTYVSGSTIQLPSGVSTDTALSPGQSGPFVNYGRSKFSDAKRVAAWTAWQESDGPGAVSSWHQLISRTGFTTLRVDPRARSRARSRAIDSLRMTVD